MKLLLALLFLSTVVHPGWAQIDYPETVLANKRVTLRIYLPDAATGFYRGTRFDWSGVIGSATCDGHAFFEPWRLPHDATGHDSIAGPAGEFGMATPLGYAEANVGETFIKIGVGHLEKPLEKEYSFGRGYRIAAPGSWTVNHAEGAITFEQSLTDPRGWGYRLTKRIALTPAGFTLGHILANTGTRRISTDHYCHNFVRIDGHPIGPAYRLHFPFEVAASVARPVPPLIAGRVLTMPSFTGSFFAELAGYAEKSGHGVTVEHAPSGLAVSIRGDRPVAKFNLYAESTAVCPEPFVRLEIEPGKEAAWKVEYEFEVPGAR